MGNRIVFVLETKEASKKRRLARTQAFTSSIPEPAIKYLGLWRATVLACALVLSAYF